MMQTILVISDNHCRLQTIKRLIKSRDYAAVFHAGDFTCDPQELLSLHPAFYFTIGNNDDPGNCRFMLKTGKFYSADNAYVIDFLGIKFVITHGDRWIGWCYDPDFEALAELAVKYRSNFLIFGHTHCPFFKTVKNVRVLNPGSVDYPRGSSQASYAEINIAGKKIVSVEIKPVK